MFRLDRSLGLALIVAFSLCASALAAGEAIVPDGEQIELDTECVFFPTLVEKPEESLVLWFKDGDGGFARRGPSFVDLASPEPWNPPAYLYRAAGQPGGMVLVWAEMPNPESKLRFRIYGADLVPLGPAGVIADSVIGERPALTVEPDGSFTVAWADPAGRVKHRRFSATGLPLTNEIEVAQGDRSNHLSLVRGADGFMVAWSEGWPNRRARGRALSSTGVPLGNVVELGAGFVELARLEAGGYLVIRGQADLHARCLTADGQPQTPEVTLGLTATIDEFLLGTAGHSAFLVWSSGQSMLGSRLDLGSFRASEPATLVAPTGWAFPRPWSLMPRTDGFVVSWSNWTHSPTQEVCTMGLSVNVGAFTLDRGMVAIPVMSPIGTAFCLLLFAVAGLSLLRLR